MSGHNKWSKIKHKKASTDAKKSKEFTRLSRLITVEAKKSGGLDLPGLKVAIEKARKVNMPNDNIERAIKKATEAGGTNMEATLYETYGPGGTAILIEALTDNKNRTAGEIKHLLSKEGLELGKPGSALWAFEKTNDGFTAKIQASLTEEESERLEKILEALDEQDDVQEIYTNAQ